MNKKIIYWTVTIIVSALMIFSGIAYFSNPEVAEGFSKMGFQDYFRVELAIAKLIGAVVLLLPMIPKNVREWTFAGFAITFVSAFIAHLSMGDPLTVSIFPIIVLGLLAVSQRYYYKLYN